MSVSDSSPAKLDAAGDLDLLAEIEAIYRQGQYVDAFSRSAPLGPLESWRGIEGRLLAARLSGCLGAPQLSHLLYRLAFREYPRHPRAIYYYATGLMRRRGPLEALQFLSTQSSFDADHETQADWKMLQARVYSAFRDFQRADQLILKAGRLAPERPWIHVEKANLLFGQDRRDEAIDAVGYALSLHPTHRPGIQLSAYFLLQLNRDDEALELLHRAALQLQSGDIFAQLAGLELELGLYEEADAHYRAAEAAFCLMRLDDRETRWLAGRQSDAAYYLGDDQRAAEKAELAAVGFYADVARNLQRRCGGQRVVLAVPFIRQQHDTCAPATLAAISNYWGAQVDHADVVNGICYDGTPAHHERPWAEEHGFLTRPFRLTETAAKALLDRGVPFTLTTVSPQTAHLQVVIGYDERRGTLLVRDPAERHIREFVTTQLLAEFASTGPRALAILPSDRSDLLAGLELPDAELYEAFDTLERSLLDHQRAAAEQTLEEMVATDPNHRLTLQAGAALASYDDDALEVLRYVDLLLTQHPDDASLQLRKLACLQQLGQHQERFELLGRIVSDEHADPLFVLQLCRELLEHTSEQDRAEELLQSGLRQRPTDASLLEELSRLRWRQRRREDSFELIRLAACVQEKNEKLFHAYYTAARFLDREPEAVALLRDRHARFINRSTSPACTLARALELLGQPVEAMALLEDAVSRHPEDGLFMLSVAKTFTRYGRRRACERMLAAAESRCERAVWMRAKIEIADIAWARSDTLTIWQEILEVEPLAIDAHQHVARLLEQQHGGDAAREHLAKYVDRYPTSHALRMLQIEWLKHTPVDAEAAIRELLRQRPRDAWAYRELAVSLGAQGKWPLAAEVVTQARALEPNSPVTQLLQAEVTFAFGNLKEAKAACRSAILSSVEYPPAIHALLSLCQDQDQRRQEIEFIRDQLERQPARSGEGVFAFFAAAEGTLDEQELLQTVGHMRHRRLDVWQLWAVNIRCLMKTDNVDEAIGLAQQMIDRFPLHPAGWSQLAELLGEFGSFEQQTRVLERALGINPAWSELACMLAEIWFQAGRLEAAQAVALQALIHVPNDLETLALLARIYKSLNRCELALDLLRKIVDLEPGYEWAWQVMREWGPDANATDMACEEARRLVRTRPHEARSWILLAESLPHNHQRDECLFALDQVLERNPRHVDAHLRKARLLTSLGLREEAVVACQPIVFGDRQPLALRAYQAEIYHQMGKHAAAEPLMREVVAEDPSYLSRFRALGMAAPVA